MKNVISEVRRRIAMKNNKENTKVWIFFNCDEHCSWSTMNPSYNDIVYRKREGRRLLWKKIKDEYEKNNIQISVDRMSDVRSAVIEGNPTDANKYLKYGFIAEMQENI